MAEALADGSGGSKGFLLHLGFVFAEPRYAQNSLV